MIISFGGELFTQAAGKKRQEIVVFPARAKALMFSFGGVISTYYMSVISLTKLYDLHSDKVGKEAAENLTNFIENKVKEEVESKLQNLVTKDDLAKTNLKISETKVDMIKWLFAFWVTLVLLIIGLYLKNS